MSALHTVLPVDSALLSVSMAPEFLAVLLNEVDDALHGYTDFVSIQRRMSDLGPELPLGYIIYVANVAESLELGIEHDFARTEALCAAEDIPF